MLLRSQAEQRLEQGARNSLSLSKNPDPFDAHYHSSVLESVAPHSLFQVEAHTCLEDTPERSRYNALGNPHSKIVVNSSGRIVRSGCPNYFNNTIVGCKRPVDSRTRRKVALGTTC